MCVCVIQCVWQPEHQDFVRQSLVLTWWFPRQELSYPDKSCMQGWPLASEVW